MIISLLYYAIASSLLEDAFAVPSIKIDRRKAVVNLPLTITCTSEVTITSAVTFFIKPIVSKGACLASGRCGTPISRYSLTQNRAQRTTTLTISSVNSTADTGTWFCQQEGEGDSGDLTVTQFATVLDWNSVSFTPSLSSLPSSVTPKQTVTVVVTTPCAAPQASFNWTYQKGLSGSPPSNTSTSQTSCPSDQVQTINTLSLPGNTSSLFNRQISLTISVEHDSFDPPSYTRTATSRSIQFPVPVTSVTMQNISSDNETVGGRLGTDLTLTCVTSASFPSSTVSWSGLPSGTTPTSTSASGLLKTTTSSVTFTLSKSDQGHTLRCTASNIAGQTSPQSNRAVLEVQYPPNAPTLPDPGTLCEGKSTTLSCSSSDPGNPAATFYWTQNNTEVHTGNTYTFTPGKDDNEVLVRCSAGNAYTDRAGHTRPQSGARQLNVYYKPQISVSGSKTRKEGQSLSLHCSADSNPGNSVLSWHFGGQNWTTSTLEKTNLSRFDDGDYTCVGRVNTGDVCPGGSLQGQKSVSVVVNYAPDINSTDLNATEGQTLTLRCVASGRPDSYTFKSFTQYWGETAVDTRTGSQSGGTYTWSTDDVSYLDTGVYECSVDNGITDRQGVLVQRKRVSVHVRAAPKFTEDFPTLQAGEVGSTVTISQSVYTSGLMYKLVNLTFRGQSVKNQSVSSVKVTLRKSDQTAVFDGYVTSATFTFHEGDIGVYTVHVCNSIGCSDSDVNLTAAGPPGKPLHFQVLSNATQTSVWLSWLPNFPGGPYTQRFHVEYRKSGEDWEELASVDESTDPVNKTMVLEVKKLSPGTVYEFRGFAVNTRTIRNKSEYTDIVRAATDKAADNPSLGLVIGAAVGCTTGGGAIIVVVVVIFIKRRSRKDDGTEEALHENSRGTDGGAEMVDNCLYARSEDVQEKPVMQENDLYAGSGDIGAAAGRNSTQKAAKKKEKKKIKKGEKIPLKTQKRGDVYENTIPGQFGAGASADYDATYANAAFVNDEATGSAAVENPQAPTGLDADGCLYVGIDFGNQKPGKVIIGDEKSPYADIAFGRVGPSPAPDEDEENKKKDTASK